MSISASTIAQSLHSTLRRTEARQTAPIERRQQFEKHMQKAAQADSAAQQTGAGGLLSADMLKYLGGVGS